MYLIKQLKMELKIPLITHVMDNVLATYTNKTNEYELFKYLIHSSKIRIAINTKMSDEYRKIFGYKFDKSLGVFVEGKYNKYCNREWHDFSVGINYVIF